MRILNAVLTFVGVALASFIIVIWPFVAVYFSYEFLYNVAGFGKEGATFSIFLLFFVYVAIDILACACAYDKIRGH